MQRPLRAQTTSTREFEQLSVVRPLRVWTHVFDRLDGSEPDGEAIEIICGPSYPIHDRPVIEPHDHEHYEISLVLAGTAIHQTAMYETTISRGSVQVVAPGKVHGFDRIDGLVIVNCAYMTEWLLHDVKELWAIEGLIPHFLAAGLFCHPENDWVPQYRLGDEEFEACVREMKDIARERDRDKPSLSYLRWCLEKIMLTLGRAFSRTDEWEKRLSFHSEIQIALRRIEAIIMENRSFHVQELAQEVGMSPDYFSRIFKQATGWSAMDYYQRRRIQHASWLLLNTPHTITEVAHTLGFCDSAHFSHLFKRQQGTSPRAYRKRFGAV